MIYRCPVCEGKMNRWMYPVLKRSDYLDRTLAIYKCVECGHEATYPDI